MDCIRRFNTGIISRFSFLNRTQHVIFADGQVHSLGEIEQVVRILLEILSQPTSYGGSLMRPSKNKLKTLIGESLTAYKVGHVSIPERESRVITYSPHAPHSTANCNKSKSVKSEGHDIPSINLVSCAIVGLSRLRSPSVGRKISFEARSQILGCVGCPLIIENQRLKQENAWLEQEKTELQCRVDPYSSDGYSIANMEWEDGHE
jgi:hypothetical protein